MKTGDRGGLGVCSEPSMDALMLQVKQRDLLAFARLYCRMLPAIKRKAVSEGWQNSAEDIAHDVFLRLLQHPDRYDGHRSAKAYVLGVARNVIREQRRAAARATPLADHPLPEPAIDHDPAAALEREELMRMLAAARSGLSNDQQLAFAMVYEQEMRPRQVAGQLGCTEDAVRMRLKAARHRLLHFLSGRMRPAILFGGIIAIARQGLSNVNWREARPGLTQWASRWAPGIGAMSLLMSASLCPDYPLGYQPPERETPLTVRLSLHGEGGPSPAGNAELQAL